MKPQDGKDLREQRSASAALRREIRARFGWLNGGPVIDGRVKVKLGKGGGVLWLGFRQDGQIHPFTQTVSPEQIKGALAAPDRLRAQFPRALPKEVGEFDAWANSMTAVPRLLLRAKGKHLPRALESPEFPVTNTVRHRAAKITAPYPHLKPLVEALVWRTPHNEKLVVADLRKLGKIAAALNGATPVLRAQAEAREHPESRILEAQVWMLRLAELAPVDQVNQLLQMIAHPDLQLPLAAIERVPLGKIDDWIESAFAQKRKARRSKQSAKEQSSGAKMPVLPEVKNGETESFKILHIAVRLAQLQKSLVRRFLELFLLVYPIEVLARHRDWWNAWEELVPWLVQAKETGPDGCSRSSLRWLRARRNELANTRLRFLHANDLEEMCVRVAGRSNVFRDVLGFLREVPVIGMRQCRAELLKYLQNAELTPTLLKEIAAFLRKNPPCEVRDFGPWAPLIRGVRWVQPEEALKAFRGDQELVRVYFESIGVLLEAGSESVDTPAAEGLPPFVRGTRDSQKSAAYFLAFEKCKDFEDPTEWGDSDCWDVLDLVIERTEQDPVAAPGTFLRFQKLTDGLYGEERRAALALLRCLCRADDPELQNHLLDEPGSRTLKHLTGLLAKKGAEVPGLPRASGVPARWMDRYPERFHRHLKALRSFMPAGEGERRASAILGKDFPDQQKLKEELTHVEAALQTSESPRMAARAAKLRSWIANPRQPGDIRIRNLERKLDAAVRETRIAKWTELIVDQAKVRYTRVLAGFGQLDAWLQSSSLAPHVIGLGELDKDERRHPLRVIKHLTQFDFRHWPENRAFIERMEAKGLRLQPWLDDISESSFAFADRGRIKVALEDEPLEILDMGRHFDTCLSPGGCNYFSVYSNLSDVNKRIVYGRIGGKVHARCLLAVSDEGTVLVFHPYSHSNGERFREIITGFAERLADKMGTIVTPTGNVSCLVSPEWYDDGAIDVGSRFGFLRDGSRFRRQLHNIRTTELRERLFEEIGKLDALTLPYLLQLPEFAVRPELILPLMKEVRTAERHLPIAIRLRAAEIAGAAGEWDYALRVLKEHGVALVRQERNLRTHWSTLWMMACAAPSSALRLLQELRPGNVRSWRDEKDRLRMLAMAEASYRLHRPNLARQLFERLDELGVTGEHFDGVDSEHITERLGALSRS